jgi:hypothetical protein
MEMIAMRTARTVGRARLIRVGSVPAAMASPGPWGLAGAFSCLGGSLLTGGCSRQRRYEPSGLVIRRDRLASGCSHP